MGNQGSLNGGLLIKTEKSCYYPGDIIKGEVHIIMRQPLKANNLKVFYLVKEYGYYHPDKHEYEHSKLLHSICCTFPFKEGIIKEGQYTYKFSIKIPINAPGSFEYYTFNAKAFLLHQIQAEIISQDKLCANIINSSLIILREKLQIYDYKTQITQKANIKNWFFGNKGTSQLSVDYFKNNYQPLDYVTVDCEIDNKQCLVKCGEIELALYQEIYYKADYMPCKIRYNTARVVSKEMCVYNL